MNEAKVEEMIEVNRAQIEHRAAWLAFLFLEMKKAGVDAEGIARRAIRNCGKYHGERYKAMCKQPLDCCEFEKVFLNPVGKSTFGMYDISSDKDQVRTTFSYCALMKSWQDMGLSKEEIELLCDIAMEGDRGIAEANGLTLDLTQTMAQGCDCCKLHFKKAE